MLQFVIATPAYMQNTYYIAQLKHSQRNLIFVTQLGTKTRN